MTRIYTDGAFDAHCELMASQFGGGVACRVEPIDCQLINPVSDEIGWVPHGGGAGDDSGSAGEENEA